MSARRSAAAAVVLAGILLAGCATSSGSNPPAAKPQDTRPAEALALVQRATPASLSQSADILKSLEAEGVPEAGAIASAGGYLYAKLYPETENPFGGVPAGSQPAMVGEFFTKLAPALALLDPAAAADASWISLLSAADSLDSASVLPAYLRGLLLQRTGAPWSDAVAAYDSCLKREPSFYPAASRISEILMVEGRAAQDLPRLEELARMLPTPQARFKSLARAELAAGQPEKAADTAAQGLLAAPADADFAILRAEALEAAGNWYQSLWVLDALLKLSPDEPEALLMKARLVGEKENNPEEALSLLLASEARFPRDARFPELRGRILMAEGSADAAAAAFTQALSLSPDRLSTLSLLVELAVGDRDWVQASTWLARIPPSSLTNGLLVQGWSTEMGLGDHEKALAYAQMLEARTRSAAALALEARSLVSAGETDKARVVVDHVLGAMETTAAMRAELYVIRAGAPSDDPARDLRAALMEDPACVEALSAMSDLLASEKEYRKALGYAKQAAAFSPRDSVLAGKVADLQALADAGD